MRNGICRTKMTSAIAWATCRALIHRRATSSLTMNDAMTGAATNSAEECACTDNHATPLAKTTHQVDGRSFPISMIAIVTFTRATATGGFQIVAVTAISNRSEEHTS